MTIIIWNRSDGSYFELDEDTQVVEAPEDFEGDLEDIFAQDEHDFGWWPLRAVLIDAKVIA